MSPRFSMEEVAHRLEIDDLYARYVHFADASDIDGLDRVFDADAVLDYTADGAPQVQLYSNARDTDLFRGRVFWRVYHFYTNLLIRFDDGFGSARTTMKVFCVVAPVTGTGSPVVEMLGMYDDLLTQRDDGWRITHRSWKPGWVSEGQTIKAPLDMGDR